MNKLSIIDRIFEPIYGKMCWNARNNIGSTLAFNFGQPRLEIIREPWQPRNHPSAQLQRHAARRQVAIEGDWCLWIYLCDWQFYWQGTLMGDSNSPRAEIKKIMFDLEGQALVQTQVEENGGATFDFDLGGQLRTIPNVTDYDDKELTEQWYLFEPSGMVFTLRADSYWSYKQSGSKEPDEWRRVEQTGSP